MTYLLDGLAILILVFCVWRGGRRGLVRTLVMLAALVAAAAATNALSEPVAVRLYDGWLGPKVEQSLVSTIQEEQSDRVVISLSSLLGEAATDCLVEQGMPASVTLELSGLTDYSAESVNRAIAPTVETVIRPAVISLLSAVVSVALFVLMLVAARLVAWLADKIFHLPGLKQLNRLGGWIAGAVTGVFWMMVFATAVQLLAQTGLCGGWLDAAMVEQTWLVSRMGVALLTWT